jgi:CMP-N,N'-diacetyllegionaminic acid synthase
MIPARSGSQRVKKKNLRLIDGKPLISYVLKTLADINIFDDIYINSEDQIFENIAKKFNIKFYKRDAILSNDSATNDQFALDFINNIKCDLLVQVLPTSPFITKEDILKFVSKIQDEDLETLISVKKNQIACIYRNSPINFDKNRVNPPSQTMEPIFSYATALMGWKTKSFIQNMNKFGSGYHGGNEKKNYYELKGISTIDIDEEEDFILAEQIILSKKFSANFEIKYYNDDNKFSVENDVSSILKKDGVVNNDLFNSNEEIVNLEKLIVEKPKNISWSKRIVDTESNSMTIIAQLPGEGNRRHYHSNWNEWWFILDGEWEWEIDGKIMEAKKGDLVFIKKNRIHKIVAKGEKMAIRMAVSRSDVDHIYV